MGVFTDFADINLRYIMIGYHQILGVPNKDNIPNIDKKKKTGNRAAICYGRYVERLPLYRAQVYRFQECHVIYDIRHCRELPSVYDNNVYSRTHYTTEVRLLCVFCVMMCFLSTIYR